MPRPLVHVLIAIALLLQGMGGAWASTRMATGDVQLAAQIAALPPCHQAAAKARSHEAAATSCCGAAGCHCLSSCGGLPALAVAPGVTGHARHVEPLAELAKAAVQAGYYGPPLRPPAGFES